MFRRVFAALFIFALTALTGCSGSTSQQTNGTPSPASETSSAPAESTVIIDGQELTCTDFAQPAGSEHCNDLMQQTFDAYKQNIDAYVSSGRLGALNERIGFSYEQIGFAGLMACAYMIDGRDRNEYYRDLADSPEYNRFITMGSMYANAWNEAPKSLCTDLEPVNENPGSSRIP